MGLLSISAFFADLRETPTLIVYLCIAVVAVVAVIFLIVLLCWPFKLTLHLGDGKTIKEKHPGFKAVELEEPKAKEGYSFGGWYADEKCTKPVGKVFRMPMRGASLYAKWIKTEQEPLAVEENESLATEEEAEAVEPAVIGALAEEVSDKAEAEVLPEEEQASAEPVGEDEEEESEAEEGDEIEGAVVTTVAGSKVFVQYRRSFTARLIQASDEIKNYYNLIRNELLSYVGVKERVSWNYDSFNVGRKQFAKINANTKSLIVYFALSANEIDEKYNFRDVSGKKRYAAVPVRYKITGSRSFKYAVELLEQTARNFGLDFKRIDDTQFIPYENRDELIRRGLIKVYAKRETGESVTAEQLDEMIAEGAKVESLSSYTVTDKVSVNEAEVLLTDATAKQLIALAETRENERDIRAVGGKRTYINLDTISANFGEGETVTLDALKQKNLIDKKASACKVLARGMLDKSLTIEATDFSLPAVKMIILTGGKVVKIKKA